MGTINTIILSCSVCGLLIGIMNVILMHLKLKKILQNIDKEIENYFQNIVGSISHSSEGINPLSSNVEKIQKDILIQFDDFMQTRLTIALPVLNMFVDDILIKELKIVFENEMQKILPKVLKDNFQNISLIAPLKNDFITQFKSYFAKGKKKYFITQLLLSVSIGIIIGVILSYLFTGTII